MTLLRSFSIRVGAFSALGAAITVLISLAVYNASSRSAQAAATAGLTGERLEYASPIELLYAPDTKQLYVLCQQSAEVRVLDARTYKELKRIEVGRVPRGFSLSPKGDRLYVANSWDDTVSVIDTKALEVIATWSVAAEPSSVVADREGKHLFVANRISNDIAVIDAQTGIEEKRLAAGRGASYITPSPDDTRLYVTHVYPNPTPHRTMPQSEITIVDTQRAVVSERIALPYVAHGFHVAFSADGRLGVAAGLHPRNLVPLAHLEHGGAFTDTLTFFGKDVGNPVELPLDELERYAVRPFGIAITPDKSRIFITCGGSEEVTVIDTSRLLRYVHMHPGSHADDLSAGANYVITRIPVGHDPRGVLLTYDGTKLLVANRLDDTISIIDTRTNKLTSTIPLVGPKQLSVLRKGEQTFYTARYSFQGQIGCANCHIDSTFDGLQWDLEPDGFGRDIVDNRPIEAVKDTEPYKWNGGNPNLPTECGPRTEKFFWRAENYDDLTLTELVVYVRSLPPRPNRWRLPAGELTGTQERGKALFNRSVDKFHNPIPENNRCGYCHTGSKGTNQKSFDVGTRKSTDNSGLLDTPQLTNIAITGPYLHDGSANTLEQIWTIFNPEDKHGRTNDLTKDELNDLIEYLRTR
ncbi:MAG TPA: beta-propeller fold lactonase family protein [Terracidiphilus sp.]|nr:beta-propeller fold lactonase family protein [Terracidiphilus sp.]